VQRPYGDVTFANAKFVVIVTGGYRGVSRALCESFAKSGATVVYADGDRDIARQVGTSGPIRSANVVQSRRWTVEYVGDGVRVASVSPGAVANKLVRASLEQQGGHGALRAFVAPFTLPNSTAS
jgi:NAD(P)-dependent dehydrogenase (short-subunit alcohol dehydrogenase family)